MTLALAYFYTLSIGCPMKSTISFFVRSKNAMMMFSLVCAAASVQAQPQGMLDRLEKPAHKAVKAAESSLNSLALAGDRTVVVGERGLILWMDGADNHWRQADVPVSSDLTAVQFVDENTGWVVGHDGVVLHSQDGGESWSLQLNGHQIAALHEALAGVLSASGDERSAEKLSFGADQGVDQSLLALHFSDANHGIVVGASNLALETRDGGASWSVISHHIDNESRLHLYGVVEALGALYVLGEQGLILKKNPQTATYHAVKSPYRGSWFGGIGSHDRLLAYGLLGNTWVTADGENWLKSDMNSSVAITSASSVSATDLVLVSLNGEVFYSNDGGKRFETQALGSQYPFYAVQAKDSETLVVAGLNGVKIIKINKDEEYP